MAFCKDFVFIHIGKCGGTTIISLLNQNNFNFSTVHLRRPVYLPDRKYLIALRNPVERFISAFYWRKYLLESGEGWQCRQKRLRGELRFHQKYESIDSLCSELYAKNGDLNLSIHRSISGGHSWRYSRANKLRFKRPEHCGMGLDFYIGKFSKKYNPQNILGIICLETLHHDLSEMFGINCNVHKKNNKANKPCVSKESKLILKKYLHKDYEVIERLNLSNLLSENQYEILSK